jgi:hypothetical protein
VTGGEFLPDRAGQLAGGGRLHERLIAEDRLVELVEADAPGAERLPDPGRAGGRHGEHAGEAAFLRRPGQFIAAGLGRLQQGLDARIAALALLHRHIGGAAALLGREPVADAVEARRQGRRTRTLGRACRRSRQAGAAVGRCVSGSCGRIVIGPAIAGRQNSQHRNRNHRLFHSIAIPPLT